MQYLPDESDSEELEELSLVSLDELLLECFLLFLRFSAKITHQNSSNLYNLHVQAQIQGARKKPFRFDYIKHQFSSS